jgi:hypothetical protein
LADLAAKNNLYDSEAKDIAQELSVLKAMGASPEVLLQAAELDKTALQEAVEYAKKARSSYAGSPLEFGSAGLNAFLSTAVTTRREGKTPNMDVAASMFGIAPEDLDKSFAGDRTYRDIISEAFTLPPTQETTFIGTDPAKPLETADIETIKTGAQNALKDALNQKTLTIAQAAATLNSAAANRVLTEEEQTQRDSYNLELSKIATAKGELDKDAVQSAIDIVGGQALIPYFINAPAAMSYDFGPVWSSATSRYTFADEAALREAANAGRILPGDYVIVNGVAGRVR